MTEIELPLPDPARIIRICDVETSGLPEEDANCAIVEIGWVDLNLETLEIGEPFALYVNPGHPIPPHVRAVHHISDRQVRQLGVSAEVAIDDLLYGLGPHDVLAAHRSAFEEGFLPDVGRRWLCTYKCAMRAFKDSVSFTNQSIRYFLDVDLEHDFVEEFAFPPHRAGPDAYVTAFILRRLICLRPLTRLLEISTEPPLSVNITFGKHKGMKWADLDYSYLEWMSGAADMSEERRAQAQYWMDRRQR